MKAILAETSSGDGFLTNLWHFALIGIGIAIIYGLLLYAIKTFGAPDPVKKGVDFVFVLILAAALLNFVMGLGGHAFIAW